ncbi:MAG: prepilin-type N-terminal cleavage/methylation domain-containing protein [Patescibacteria group bacterium]
MLSRKKPTTKDSKGFTLVELLVVFSLVAILFVSFGSFFTNYLYLYFGYQKDANSFSEIANQATRISDVMRGITDITSETSTDLNAYAYFAPTDTYVSVVRYYLSADGKSVMVDVTPMTSNPPNGTVITAAKKTYTIISSYKPQTGVNLFTYYDISGTALTPPVANQHTITSIGVNLSTPAEHNSQGQQLAVTVSLRNRKTNL